MAKLYKDINSNNIGVSLAYQWKGTDTLIKTKISRDMRFAISTKYRLNKHFDYIDGYYGFGLEVSELGTKNRFKFGSGILVPYL